MANDSFPQHLYKHDNNVQQSRFYIRLFLSFVATTTHLAGDIQLPDSGLQLPRRPLRQRILVLEAAAATAILKAEKDGDHLPRQAQDEGRQGTRKEKTHLEAVATHVDKAANSNSGAQNGGLF
eukprot:COSAG06_NODE_4988_length_3804_cov_2162.275574_1_plen_123_part_00